MAYTNTRDWSSRGQNRSQPVAAARRHRPDYLILILTLILLTIGLILVYSIGPALAATRGGTNNTYVTRQFIAVLLSAVAFMITAKVPLKMWRKWQWAILGLAFLGTFIALLTPVVPEYPAHRWIRFGSSPPPPIIGFISNFVNI